MIDAFEKGHYWAVLENIDQADDHHIEKLADAFNEFGLYEITMMTHQASAKAKFLDKLQTLWRKSFRLVPFCFQVFRLVYIFENMSVKYKIRNQASLYFITMTVVNWIDVFSRNIYKDLFIESYQSQSHY
jgi:hypothetical protein